MRLSGWVQSDAVGRGACVLIGSGTLCSVPFGVVEGVILQIEFAETHQEYLITVEINTVFNASPLP